MERLGTGEVGYLVCGVKNVLDARVGDTITNAKERERKNDHARGVHLPAQLPCVISCGCVCVLVLCQRVTSRALRASADKPSRPGVEPLLCPWWWRRRYT